MNNIDHIFKRALNGAQSTAPVKLWSKIETHLPTPSVKTSANSRITVGENSIFSSIITTTVLIGSLTTFGFLFIENNQIETIPFDKQILSPQSMIEKESTQKKENRSIQLTVEKPQFAEEIDNTARTSLEKNQEKKTIKTVLDLERISSSSIEKPVNNSQVVESPVETTENANQEKAEKIFKKGDYVTFKIKYSNTSGKRVKSLKVWEEFPEWCDASSLETINYNSTHEVKTVLKSSQNTVEWKIKGDFSPDALSPRNSGFIEYRVKINEDRKASELEKNLPGVK